MIHRGSKHHRIRRPHRLVRKAEPAKREKIATPVNSAPNHSVEFAKLAINLMFLANGGSATTILVNMDTDKFFIPLIMFSFGITESILVAIYFAINTPFEVFNQNTKFISIKFIISIIVLVVPCLLFFFGVISMRDIMAN